MNDVVSNLAGVITLLTLGFAVGVIIGLLFVWWLWESQGRSHAACARRRRRVLRSGAARG